VGDELIGTQEQNFKPYDRPTPVSKETR